MPANPYMDDNNSRLAMLLMSLGSGMGQAGAAGRPFYEGFAPAAGMFGNALAQWQQMGMQRQQQEEAMSLRKRALGLQESELADKQAERTARLKGMGAWAEANDPSRGGQSVASVTPGMGPPSVEPRMGPQDYGTRTAGLEGGQKNGGFVFNELGSGAFGPYQFMPNTWADVRAKNPDLNLPADMTTANRDQHKAAFDSFSKGNAAILQQAGIQPTPENLYLAHRFGAGGATTMLRADPNARLADVLPPDWQRQNPDMRGQTVDSFKRLAGERMRGVGQPYQAGGEQTSMGLQPANYRPGGPQVAQAPQNIAQGDNVTVQPMAAPPPSPPQVPRPMLTSEEYASIKAAATTPKEAEELKNKTVNEKWKRLQDVADKTWQQERDDYRFNRGEASKADQWYTLSQDDVKMLPGLDPSKAHQKNRRTGEVKPIGGSLVNIDQKSETEFSKEMGKNDAKRLGEIQENTSRVTDISSRVRMATDLLKQTYTGPGGETANAFFKTLGSLGVESAKDKADAATAATSIINELMPRMRAPGSGATSDMEMRVFASALPGMLNAPGGNDRIAAYWDRISERALKVQEIAEGYATENKRLTGTEFAKEVKALGPLFSADEIKEMQAAGKTKAEPPAPPAGFKVVTPGGMSPMPNTPPPPAGFRVMSR